VTVIERERARRKKTKQGKITCQTSSATGKLAVNELVCKHQCELTCIFCVHKYTNKLTHCTYLFVCTCHLYVLQIEIPYMSYANMGCESSDAWRITSTDALQMESTPSRSGNHNGNPKNPTTSHQPMSIHSLIELLIDCYSFETRWISMDSRSKNIKCWQEPST